MFLPEIKGQAIHLVRKSLIIHWKSTEQSFFLLESTMRNRHKPLHEPVRRTMTEYFLSDPEDEIKNLNDFEIVIIIS